MDIAPAQIFSSHDLPGSGLDQRWSPKKNRALMHDDDGFITHRRDIRPASGAGPHNHSDLRNAFGRHGCLIIKNPTKMIPIRKHFILIRQVGTTGIDQIQARQIVLISNFLRAQMFFNRDRIIGAALDGRVITHDDTFLTRHPSDTRNNTGGRRSSHAMLILIHVVGGELREFKKRCSRVK